MKQQILYSLLVGAAAAHPAIMRREVPQEHAHQAVLDQIDQLLGSNNPDNIKSSVFGLLGAKAAAEGAGNIKDADCLQQAAADQAFSNAKAANDIAGQTAALIYRGLERNSGKVGLASPPCASLKAVNPEIAAIQQHQDPAGDGAQELNKQITLEIAKQISAIGGNAQDALEAGTFKPGDPADPTAKGNTCDDANDKKGCIDSLNLRVDDVTAAEIDAAVAGAGGNANAAASNATATAGNAAAGNASAAAGNAAAGDAAANNAAASNATAAAGGKADGKAAKDAAKKQKEADKKAKDAAKKKAAADKKAADQAAKKQKAADKQAADKAKKDAKKDDKAAGANNAAAGNAAAGNATAAADNSAAASNAAAGNAAAGNAAAGNAAAGNAAAGAFGSCADPSILFSQNPSDGRGEPAFESKDQTDFPHGSALAIKVIADFTCNQLTNKCKAGADAVAKCQSAATAASSLKAQAAADAFNQALGV